MADLWPGRARTAENVTFAAAAIDYLKHSGKPAGSISFLITGDEEDPAIHGFEDCGMDEANGHIPTIACGRPTCVAKLGDTIKIGRRPAP